MAKFEEKIKARKLRRMGYSIKKIGKKLFVSPSTVSKWCLDIKLTPKQISILDKNRIVGGYKGRMIGARIQKDRKLEQINKFRELGIKSMSKVNDRDLFMLGLGLYFGEGGKGDNRFQFTNSNPDLVRIIVIWLERIFCISRKDMYCRVLINEIHRNRINKVEKEWLAILALSPNQLRRTTFIKSKSVKVYENNNSYLGTLALNIKKSSSFQRRILGLMHGLVYNLRRP